MKRIYIIVLLLMLCIFTNASCYAITKEREMLVDENGEEHLYLIYTLNENEEQDFLNKIEQKTTYQNKKYVYKTYEVGNGDIEESKQVTSNSNIISKSKDKEKIIDEFPEEKEYSDKEGYMGTLYIDKNSLSIETIDNGYYEYLIEETKEYNNLEKNDLSYIPKQIKKNNKVLDLITTKWKVESTKNIGEHEVPDKYTAVCYYATKQRVDYPDTYKATVTYRGETIKIIKMPKTYTLIYEQEKDSKMIKLILGTGGTATLFVVVLFLIYKNAKVYNYKDNKWVLVARVHLSSTKPKIKLDKYKHLEITNRYKIELSNNIFNKLKGKYIEITKDNRLMRLVISREEKEKSFEINV